MPIIQQENGVKTVKGLPLRWGIKAYRALKNARGDALGVLPERYKKLSAMLDTVTNAPIPLDATDAQLCVAALYRAEECFRQTEATHDKAVLRQRMTTLCELNGIEAPACDDDKQVIARCCDPAWWRRQFRKVFGRTFEHAAIRLGFVSIRAGAYASNETVIRRMAQNKRNAATLDAVKMENELGQSYSVAELVASGISNKKVRRSELMLRMRGCEEIATDLGDVGFFVTLTCPSKYHAVMMKSGTENPAYNGATPRRAQAYLQNVWQCIRAAYGRLGIEPYGFRIAEPHHDGCPHWHMLVFVSARHVEALQDIFRTYALAEDGDEPGAKRNRIKIVRIEAGKGTAAGYIAKYVGKNIDDEHVPDHKTLDGGVIQKDLIGDEVIRPCQRVEAWAACWGIRQFQPIGQPPVTVWREIRRIKAEAVEHAPDGIKAAYTAAQKNEEEEQRADYAAYIRAQGGVCRGRDYLIRIATELTLVQGRYGVSEADKPVGIYAAGNPAVIYASTRYLWRVVGKMRAVDVPWTRVNNCTEPAWVQDVKQHESIEEIDFSVWFSSDEYQNFALTEHRKADMLDWAFQNAIETRKNTVWTVPSRKNNA